MMIFKRTSQNAVQKRFASPALWLSIMAVALWVDTSAAEKLVDPDSVAPEYRQAAEKRRAEQLRLLQCSRKADEAKVPRRDRAAHISACISN